MASALIGGMLQRGFSAAELAVVDISSAAQAHVTSAFGVRASADFETVATAEVVVLAVKPQQLREVARKLSPSLGNALAISIAAGIRTSDLSRWLGGHSRIVRAMPNMPALIGAGVSGLYAMPGVTPSDRETARRIVSAVGAATWFEREQDLDIVTAVSGSGPAYVIYFIEAIEEAARALGLDSGVAKQLTIDTFIGSAKLAAQSGESSAALRARVTSKGGTTERALAVMEAARVKAHISEAVSAAAQRARELGDASGKD